MWRTESAFHWWEAWPTSRVWAELPTEGSCPSLASYQSYACEALLSPEPRLGPARPGSTGQAGSGGSQHPPQVKGRMEWLEDEGGRGAQ